MDTVAQVLSVLSALTTGAISPTLRRQSQVELWPRVLVFEGARDMTGMADCCRLTGSKNLNLMTQGRLLEN